VNRKSHGGRYINTSSYVVQVVNTIVVKVSLVSIWDYVNHLISQINILTSVSFHFEPAI